MIGSANPSMTVVIVSHNKPDLLAEAVQSVLDQSFTDWQGILIDSGLLYDRGFFEQSLGTQLLLGSGCRVWTDKEQQEKPSEPACHDKILHARNLSTPDGNRKYNSGRSGVSS